MKLRQLTGRLSHASRISALFGALFFFSFFAAAKPGDPDLAEDHALAETLMEEAVQPMISISAPGALAVSYPDPDLGSAAAIWSGAVANKPASPVEVIRGDYCGLENPVPGVYLICCKPSKNICIVTPEVGDGKGIFRVPDAAADSPARSFKATRYDVSRSPGRVAVRFTGVTSLAGTHPR